MYEALVKIDENSMTWSELKTLCESRGLRIVLIAIKDKEGKILPDSFAAIPPDAQLALHFKTAEIDSDIAETVSESAGYIDSQSREITKEVDLRSGEVRSKVLETPENQVHGIKLGGL